jgi:hypothetical protein
MNFKITIDDGGLINSHEVETEQLGELMKVIKSSLWGAGFTYIDDVVCMDEYNKVIQSGLANPKEDKVIVKNKLDFTFHGDDGEMWTFNPNANHMYHNDNRMAEAEFNSKEGVWTVAYFEDREFVMEKTFFDKEEKWIETELDDYVYRTGRHDIVTGDNVLPLFTFNNKTEKDIKDNLPDGEQGC